MLFKRLKKPNPEAEQELRNEIEAAGGLEKNDLLAMIISAMFTILPFACIFLLLIVGLAFLIF